MRAGDVSFHSPSFCLVRRSPDGLRPVEGASLECCVREGGDQCCPPHRLLIVHMDLFYSGLWWQETSDRSKDCCIIWSTTTRHQDTHEWQLFDDFTPSHKSMYSKKLNEGLSHNVGNINSFFPLKSKKSTSFFVANVSYLITSVWHAPYRLLPHAVSPRPTCTNLYLSKG